VLSLEGSTLYYTVTCSVLEEWGGGWYFKILKIVTVVLMLAGDLAIRNTQTQQLYRPLCVCK
jgi:hypothetical protein